jgi:PAS domain S-box-containing protein
MSGHVATVAFAEPQHLWPLFIAGVGEYAALLLDPEGRIQSWNLGAELIVGYRFDEIIGRDLSCCYTAEDIERGKPESERKIAATTGCFNSRGERVRKDGSRFLADVVTRAIRAPDGALLGFGQIINDITERTTAEAMIRASESRLRSLVATVLDTVVDGLITIDRSGIIQSFNRPAFCCSVTPRMRSLGRTCAY